MVNGEHHPSDDFQTTMYPLESKWARLDLPPSPRRQPEETIYSWTRPRANHHLRNRLGILTMILCFALGIANLFTANVLIIILSAVCLYVPSSPSSSLAPSPSLANSD